MAFRDNDMRLKMFLVITLCFFLDSSVYSCPREECICVKGEIYCDTLGYRTVPEFYPENRTYDRIDLSHNNIKRIKGNAFANVRVRKIKMRQNSVGIDIHRKTFRGSEELLEVVDMSKSHLATLPQSLFSKMQKLKSVFFSGNRFQSLPKGVFRGANSIQTLDLMDNLLVRLNGGVFAGLENLKVLRLGNNRISTIDSEAFRGLGNLEDLILTRNQIRDLQPKSFKKLTNLRRLDLGNNKIPALFPLMFRGLEKLEELSLNDNPLILIGEAAFSSMGSLRILYLGEGKLRYLKANMFKGLDKLELLQLDKNNITYLQDGVFKYLPTLQKLHMMENKLTTVNPCAFNDIRMVKEIRAIQNPLVCTCAFQWTALQMMPNVAGRCTAPSKLRRMEVGAKSNYEGCKTEDIIARCTSGSGGSLATAKVPLDEEVNQMKNEKSNRNHQDKPMKDWQSRRSSRRGGKQLKDRLKDRARKNRKNDNYSKSFMAIK